MPMVLLGYFLGALFFTGLFQGGVLEALTAGAAGVVAGLCVMGLSKLEVNFFFKTIAAAAVLGMVIYGLRALGLPVDTGIAAISALMVLVPGLVFTNFMCDLITGDMVSGLSTFVRAVLTATAHCHWHRRGPWAYFRRWDLPLREWETGKIMVRCSNAWLRFWRVLDFA